MKLPNVVWWCPGTMLSGERGEVWLRSLVGDCLQRQEGSLLLPADNSQSRHKERLCQGRG